MGWVEKSISGFRHFGFSRRHSRCSCFSIFNTFCFLSAAHFFPILWSKLVPFSLPLSSLSYSVAILFWHLTFWIEVLHPDFGVTCRATYVNTSVKKCMVSSSSRLDFTDMFVCKCEEMLFLFIILSVCWFAKDWLVVWECYEIITRYQIEFTKAVECKCVYLQTALYRWKILECNMQ